MSNEKNNFFYKKPLTDEELLRMIEEDDLDEFGTYIPLDNANDTDTEEEENEESNEDNAHVVLLQHTIAEVNVEEAENNKSEEEEYLPVDERIQNVEAEENEIQRKWVRKEKETANLGQCHEEGINEIEFSGCTTSISVFLKLLGPALSKIVFESNLYATQRGKTLKLEDNELLCFVGINFLMGYHQLPNVGSYWSTSPDLSVPLVNESMARNRFQEILTHLHINDNSLLTKDNKDKLYKIRPLLEILNNQFRMLYYGTRELSVDESIVKFKGRYSLKQYNPMKPVKRGYKLWCLADQHGFVKKFEVYQGRNEAINAKYKNFNLGERVVLFLTEEEKDKRKIVYFDNFYTSIKLLEVLRGQEICACGTIRNNRKGLPTNMKEDKMMKRGEVDTMVSNTDITYYKWKDNRIVHLASNFHGTEGTVVLRRDKTGKVFEIPAPSIIKDYNKFMGGVDQADRLRYCYTIDRRSKKWWHRLFWAAFEILFINSYIICKHFLHFDESTKDLLSFRRDLTMGLLNMSNLRKRTKRSSGSSSGLPVKKEDILTVYLIV